MTLPTKKLGEVIEFLQKSSRRAGDGLNNGKFPFFTSSPIQKKFLNIADYKEEAIILGTGGSASIHICKNFSTSADVFIIKSYNKDRLDNKYLYLFLVASTLILNEGFKGAALKHLSKEYLKNIEIPLPPLEIQKKIVAKLESLLTKVNKAKKLRSEAQENADNLLSAELHKIFEEGKSKGWEEKTVEDMSNGVQYGFTATAGISGNTRLLRITDIQNGVVDWSSVPFCNCKEVDKYKLEDGDIVFARTGATVGKSYLIKNPPENAIFASYLIRTRVNKSEHVPEFLYYFFQSPQYWNLITEQRVGGAQPNVNGSKLKKLKLPVPTLAEQKEIVAYLDSISQKVQAVKKLQDTTENELDALEQSILSKAFSGELVEEKETVHQVIPSPFYRNQVNAAIVEQVTVDGGATTEVAVAKYNYLLQEICGVPLGYEFAESKFGPFDAKVKKLIWSGLGRRNRWFSKNRGMVVEGQNVSALLARKTNLYWKAKAGMKRLAELGITKLNVNKVELLSTVYHSMKQVNSTDLQKVRDFMSNWQTNGSQTKADKFTEEQTQKCINFIVKNKLHKKLT